MLRAPGLISYITNRVLHSVAHNPDLVKGLRNLHLGKGMRNLYPGKGL